MSHLDTLPRETRPPLRPPHRPPQDPTHESMDRSFLDKISKTAEQERLAKMRHKPMAATTVDTRSHPRTHSEADGYDDDDEYDGDDALMDDDHHKGQYRATDTRKAPSSSNPPPLSRTQHERRDMTAPASQLTSSSLSSRPPQQLEQRRANNTRVQEYDARRPRPSQRPITSAPTQHWEYQDAPRATDAHAVERANMPSEDTHHLDASHDNGIQSDTTNSMIRTAFMGVGATAAVGGLVSGLRAMFKTNTTERQVLELSERVDILNMAIGGATHELQKAIHAQFHAPFESMAQVLEQMAQEIASMRRAMGVLFSDVQGYKNRMDRIPEDVHKMMDARQVETEVLLTQLPDIILAHVDTRIKDSIAACINSEHERLLERISCDIDTRLAKLSFPATSTTSPPILPQRAIPPRITEHSVPAPIATTLYTNTSMDGVSYHGMTHIVQKEEDYEDEDKEEEEKEEEKEKEKEKDEKPKFRTHVPRSQQSSTRSFEYVHDAPYLRHTVQDEDNATMVRSELRDGNMSSDSVMDRVPERHDPQDRRTSPALSIRDRDELTSDPEF